MTLIGPYPLVALSGHPSVVRQCPLSRAKRTSRLIEAMSAFDPKADMGGLGLLPRNLIPKPYIAGRKTLL